MECWHIKHFDYDYKDYWIINSSGGGSGSSGSSRINNDSCSSGRDIRLCINTEKYVFLYSE